MIYDNKEAFLALGVESITPSSYAASKDCDICVKPLAMFPTARSAANDATTVEESPFHPALRILSCRHIHGTECLTAWLDFGNTCLTCSRILFTAPSEQPITQAEVDWVVNQLGPQLGEDAVFRWVARHMEKNLDEGTKKRQLLESKIALDKVKEEEKERKDREEFSLGENDFLAEVEDDDEDYEYFSGGSDEEFVSEGNDE
jgi:hypothetical protein